MAVLLGCACAGHVVAQASQEYQIKAVFLFNFAQFVEWPATAFKDPRQAIAICVLGADPFGPYLEETIREERIGDRALTVQRFDRVEDTAACHMLFISRSESTKMTDIIAWLNGRSILSVSDADRFASLGGMIRFVTRNNRISFRINVDTAKAAGLTISSKLLRASEIVAMRED